MSWDENEQVKIVGSDPNVPVEVTPNGELVVRNLTADIKWDAIVPTFNATSDVYVFKFGGVTTATITVSYVDSTKEVLSGVTKVVV